MSDLEVRQLRYFVAVAEELHFGRAAERLGMAQPPLSRAIRELERHLGGVRLLERTTRQVALTPAGEVFLHDARTALDAVTAAARRARHAGQPTPSLRLALKADFDAGLLPQILAAFQCEDAALPVELLLGGRGEQVPALRDGRADIALLPAPFDDRDLDVEPLVTEPRLLALAADDPLAARSCLRLADLAGRSLPDGTPADWDGRPPTTARTHNGRQQPQTALRGRVAGTQPVSLDLAQIFNLVGLGSIIWFLPASVVSRHRRFGIVYRTVSDLPPSTLALAWPQDSRLPAVAAFVRAATAVAKSVQTDAQADAETPQRAMM
ncbi:LysR family transcriptional regulator [Candidatus Frankia alpina]|uniref:LysR family transcriptional regulator n=1 Tax=Candidatus Frankia alpina TaxID=2699483 RepID=A0A4S5ES87_9ACTN|nr:LysR substrate-binding domain-containing protein [Candidatus Frankia alpina]THJ75287.1 LysR family transcriptional regulator [Candidatus Frankia alpina]